MSVLLTDYSGHQIEIRWVRLEASTRETRNLNGFEWGNLRDRGHFEHLGEDGNIILKWILIRMEERGLDSGYPITDSEFL
jgi:hypothetical protein